MMRKAAWGALIATAVSCGDNRAPLFDAATTAADASSKDARSDAALSTMVRVVVAQPPVGGVRVVFHSAQGDVTADLTTDSNGHAEALVDPGSWVTVISEPPGKVRVYTVANVEPGDVIAIGEPQPAPTTMTVALPTWPSAASYRLYAPGCGEWPAVPPRTLAAMRCAPGFVTDMALVAYGANGQALAAAVRSDVSVSLGATISIDDSWLSAATVSVRYRGLGVASAQVGASSESTKGLLASEPLAGLTIIAGVGTASIAQIPFPSARAVHDLVVTNGAGQQLRRWRGDFVSMIDQDVSGDWLPYVTTQPTYSTAAGQLQWSSSPGARVPDAVVGVVEFARAGGLDGAWAVVAPASPNQNQLAFPAWPWMAAMHRPIGDDAIAARVQLLALPGGYHSARALALRPSRMATLGAGLIVTSTTTKAASQ